MRIFLFILFLPLYCLSQTIDGGMGINADGIEKIGNIDKCPTVDKVLTASFVCQGCLYGALIEVYYEEQVDYRCNGQSHHCNKAEYEVILSSSEKTRSIGIANLNNAGTNDLLNYIQPLADPAILIVDYGYYPGLDLAWMGDHIEDRYWHYFLTQEDVDYFEGKAVSISLSCLSVPCHNSAVHIKMTDILTGLSEDQCVNVYQSFVLECE